MSYRSRRLATTKQECERYHLPEIEVSSHVEKLVHVEIALEDPLLHGIRHPRLGHLTNGWLHDRNALSTLVRRTGRAQHGRGAGDGASLGSRSEVLSEIVTFAC
jgi:hypothetical protein